MSTLKDLIAQQAALDRQIAEAMKSARTEAIAQIRTLMTQNGLTAADLVAPAGGRANGASTDSRAKVAPKYRHPETGATWTGRGLKPRWLAEQLASGKQMSDFAI